MFFQYLAKMRLKPEWLFSKVQYLFLWLDESPNIRGWGSHRIDKIASANFVISGTTRSDHVCPFIANRIMRDLELEGSLL